MGNTVQQWRASIGCWNGASSCKCQSASGSSSRDISMPDLNFFMLVVLAMLLVIAGIEINPGPLNHEVGNEDEASCSDKGNLDIFKIIKSIFGDMVNPALLSPDSTQLRENSKVIIQEMEKQLNPNPGPYDFHIDERKGRFGPPIAKLYKNVTSDDFEFVSDCHIRSNCTFCTVISSGVYICEGKWQYEVQLVTDGIIQIGWTYRKFLYKAGTGIGDNKSSYAYDGSRKIILHDEMYSYGDSTWTSGDIIGVTIDFDSKAIEFYKNGHSMGVAFSDISPGRYRAGISLDINEEAFINLGVSPLSYPVPSFMPLQEAPAKDVQKAKKVLDWMSEIISIDCYYLKNLVVDLSKNLIQDYLGTLLTSPYIIEDCFFPFLCDLQDLKEKTPASNKNSLIDFLDMSFEYLQEEELQDTMTKIIVCLNGKFQETSCDLQYKKQNLTLQLLTSMLNHTPTRRLFLKLIDDQRLMEFMVVKKIDEWGLENMIKNPTWWEIKENKTAVCLKIQSSVGDLEKMQVELLKTLLNNQDGTSTEPSSRCMFIKKLRSFLNESFLSSSTEPQIPLAGSFHILVVTFRHLWEGEVKQDLPSHIFHDENFRLIDVLREEEHPLKTSDQTHEVDSTRPTMSTGAQFSSIQQPSLQEASLLEILDLALFLFHCSAKHYQENSLITVYNDYEAAVGSINAKLVSYAGEDDDNAETRELQESSVILKQKLNRITCHMAWGHGAIFTPDKIKKLSWILQLCLNTLKEASRDETFFSLLPEWRIELIADIGEISLYYGLELDTTEDLCSFLLDATIFLAENLSSNKMALEAMMRVLQCFLSPSMVLFLERLPHDSCEKITKTLLRPYSAWEALTSTFCLVRIWQGSGFAFRYKKSPHLKGRYEHLIEDNFLMTPNIVAKFYAEPSPSHLFQAEIKQMLLCNQHLATEFLHSLLSQLDCSFKEFLRLQQASRFFEEEVAEAVRFNETVAILRVLEMVAVLAGQVFVDFDRSSAEQLLNQLFELVCRILNHTSSTSFKVSVNVPALQDVHQFPILGATMGILITLLREEIEQCNGEDIEIPKITNTLLTTQNFNLKSIHSEKQVPGSFSFTDYTEDVNEVELKDLNHMINHLIFNYGKL